MMPKFRNAYTKAPGNPDMFLDENGEPRVSMTQQHFEEVTNINKIIRKYRGHDLITHVTTSTAAYGDFSEINEYAQSLNIVNTAKEAFLGIPADIRAKFDNDPGKFFEFASDPRNHDALVDMGLAEARPTPPSAPPEVVSASAPPEVVSEGSNAAESGS